MDEVIQLKTLGSAKWLKMLKNIEDKGSTTYILKGDTSNIVAGYNENGNKYLALHRGPTITEGKTLSSGERVFRILFSNGKHIVILDSNDISNNKTN
jgi:hypothetical protein